MQGDLVYLKDIFFSFTKCLCKIMLDMLVRKSVKPYSERCLPFSLKVVAPSHVISFTLWLLLVQWNKAIRN